MTLSDRDRLKRAAALRAVDEIRDGMAVGLGTGSTATYAVAEIGVRIAKGLRLVCAATSERTAEQARSLGIPLVDIGEQMHLDLTIDGADEVERGTLNLVKGLGGALLREKIVAAASARLIIIVDAEKLVDRLGTHAPIPVEIVRFGWQTTMRALASLGSEPVLRGVAEGDAPFLTDNGNYIVDCRFAPLTDAAATERLIGMTVGVVESGLFIGRAESVVIAGHDGVEVLHAAGAARTDKEAAR